MEKTNIVLPEDMVCAGTGEMQALCAEIKELQEKGYNQNFVVHFDHFTYDNDPKKLYAKDIFFDEVVRFENTSDPDDQAILYAITAIDSGVKGIYIESYGFYHEDLAPSMIDRMKFCHFLRQQNSIHKPWAKIPQANQNSTH